MPMQGQPEPEEIAEDMVKAGQNALDLQNPFLNYEEKGNRVELLGKEKVAGVDCFKLKLTNKFGKESISYIDTTNYYRIKTIGKVVVSGVAAEVETIYSDFKENADGYIFSYSQTTPNGAITFSSIETNIPVDTKIFSPN